ncbi:MAG: ABC transporter permease, partial [Candidatus Thorarchaeota archaeon]
EQSEMGGISFSRGDGDSGSIQTSAYDLTLGVIDLDTTRTYEGEDLSENFTAYLRMMVTELIQYNDTFEAYRDLYAKVIDGYVVIPDGFEANLTINEPTYVDLHMDATNALGQSSVMGVVQTAAVMFRASKLWIRSEIFPTMVIEFTPRGGFVESVFGGFIVIISSYLGIAMTSAQAIVGDIPLRRLLLTPTSRLEVVIAKVLAYVIIGFFQSLLLVTLWLVAFDLDMNTSFLTLVVIMSLTSLTGASTGILISAISSTRLQANQMFLFVMFGTLILSGFFIDVGILDRFLPLNLGLKVLVATAFKGLSLLDVIDKVVVLLGFSVMAILAATFIFSKKPTLA